MFSLYFVVRVVSERHFFDIRNYGVYDVLSQQLKSGNSLCSGFSQDGLGTYPDDPTIADGFCYYGGQTDPAKGDCAAPSNVAAGNRRVCPCSQFGKRTCFND